MFKSAGAAGCCGPALGALVSAKVCVRNGRQPNLALANQWKLSQYPKCSLAGLGVPTLAALVPIMK